MKNPYIKELPRALLIGFSIFVTIILIQFLNGGKIAFDSNLKSTFFYTILYSFSLHFANTFLFVELDKFFKEDRFSRTRILIGFISSFFLSIFVIFVLRFFINIAFENQSIKDFIENETPSNYITSSIFTFIVLIIIHFIFLYKWYQENKVKEQKIIAGTASAKYESLKNQIDPHFLFNSLNVLSSLIEENPENAQKFTTSLSKVYRYVLEQKDKDLVSVEEELAFAKTYMNLLKMRFENSLTYELPAEQLNPEAKVVPLSLQLLLENTVKHNVVSEQKPLHIKIYIENDYLVIENNFQKKEVLQNRQGVGLQNIINRYAIISKRKVQIEQTQNVFKVKLPLLTKQISIMETQSIYSENNAYYNAKQKVEEIRGFYGNLISYVVVNGFLLFINLRYSPSHLWFYWPMMGWGIGVFFHAMRVYNFIPFLGKDWEEKKLKQFMVQQKSNKNNWK